jgi:hypothetical protein
MIITINITAKIVFINDLLSLIFLKTVRPTKIIAIPKLIQEDLEFVHINAPDPAATAIKQINL